MKRTQLFIVTCLIACLSSSALAAITGAVGNDPVNDPGWPKGALEVANLKTRVAYWEGPPFGGGQYEHLYRGDTAAFNAALEVFSKMRTPVRELVIFDGPHESFYMKIPRGDDKKIDARIDWSFTVWVPANWHRLYSKPGNEFFAQDQNFRKPLDPPRMRVYIGGGGLIDFEKVKVPTNIRVVDQRAAASGVTVEGGAMVRVNVYDMATGKPVAGAVLKIDERSEKATPIMQVAGNEDGFIEAKQIAPAIRRLSIEARGYAPRLIGYEDLKATTFLTYDIELSAAATISGTVVDEAGKPVAGVTVRSNAMGIDGRGYQQVDRREVKTDEHGRFELTGLPTGYTQLRAIVAKYHQPEFMIVHGVPAKDVTLRVEATGAIKGKVQGADGRLRSGSSSRSPSLPAIECATWITSLLPFSVPCLVWSVCWL